MQLDTFTIETMYRAGAQRRTNPMKVGEVQDSAISSQELSLHRDENSEYGWYYTEKNLSEYGEPKLTVLKHAENVAKG